MEKWENFGSKSDSMNEMKLNALLFQNAQVFFTFSSIIIKLMCANVVELVSHPNTCCI